MKRIAAIPMLLATLCGCDFALGVSRYTPKLKVAPTPSCAVAAVSSIPGVVEVESEVRGRGGEVLASFDTTDPDQTMTVRYKYDNLRNSLAFSVLRPGTITFTHHYSRLNRAPPQSDVDLIHPIMLQIDRALEAQCGVTDLGLKIKESCRAVQCTGA